MTNHKQKTSSDKDAKGNARRVLCSSRMLSRSAVFAFCLLAFITFALISCTPKKEFPSSSDTSGPVQIVTNSILYLYNGPYKAWKLESKALRKSLDDRGSTLGYPVKLTIYDSLGTMRSICLADTGSTNDKKDAFEAWGNVYVKNEEGTVVRAQRLRWDGSRHTVSSDSFVQITTANGDVMRGKGLDATETFSRWSLRKEVSGEFPNFRKRMDSEEGFFGDKKESGQQSADPAQKAVRSEERGVQSSGDSLDRPGQQPADSDQRSGESEGEGNKVDSAVSEGGAE